MNWLTRCMRPKHKHGLADFMLLLLVGLVVFGLPGMVLAKVKDIPDADITNEVEFQLAVDPAVSSHLINVTTNNGIVILSGPVDNILAKDKAVARAQAVKGVRSVVDRLEVAAKPPSDKNLEANVVAALASDPAADSYEIKVKAKDGVITLDGSVDSWAERRLSEHVAKGVKGVKGVVNNVIVDFNTQRKDSEILADIKRLLAIDVLVDHEMIDVEVNAGKVKLTGVVGSAAEKNRAELGALVNSVDSVDTSGLKVEWWAKDKMVRPRDFIWLTDKQIEEAVRDAFFYDPRVSSFNPMVSVHRGVVTLSGLVENLAAKRAAEETAENTVGVSWVRNLLRVRPEEMPSDKVLKQRVGAALQRDPFVDSDQISIRVVNGKAYLNGRVDSAFEKERAESATALTNGVVDVKNNLRLEGTWSRKDDWEIQRNIESQLWWSPFVDSDGITVTVEKGVATLTGTVENWAERRAATENALEAGALAVWNQLRVWNGPAASWM